MAFIKTSNLVYEYTKFDEDGNPADTMRAIDDVDISINQGDFVAILGHNGSGKSTLAKHLNALYMPTDGTVWVGHKNTRQEDNVWDIRQTTGMVFQNPDNQIIGNTVEEDVAFGPENLGVETNEIWKRVKDSLKAVDMVAYKKKSPNKLSGGQKQRVAIAGVMAMKTKCIVLDEPTAMLDPNGRKEVIKTVHDLNKAEGITIILITHYMEEVVNADRVIVMDDGKVVMDGTPRQIFSDIEKLKKYRLDVPQVTELSYELKKAGIIKTEPALTIDELVEQVAIAYNNRG